MTTLGYLTTLDYMHKVRQIARGLGISDTQLRNWGGEFAEYLSDSANPGKGETRLYDDDDLAVLETIAVLRNQETSYPDIHKALSEGKRLELSTPQETQTRETIQDALGDDQKRLAIVTELQSRVARFQGELDATKAERDRLVNEKNDLQDKLSKMTERALRAETIIGVQLGQGTPETPAAPNVQSKAVNQGEDAAAPASSPTKRRAWWRFWE